MSALNEENQCHILGDADFHGLGIRIGFYLQWFSTALAFSYLPNDYPGLATMSYLIATAVAVAILINYKTIYAAEAIILTSILMIPQQLCLIQSVDFVLFIYKHVTVATNWINPKYNYRWIEVAADITRLFASLFLLGVVIWTFFTGMDVMQPADCDPTLLGSHYLSGTFRSLLQAWSIVLILGCVLERLFFIHAKWAVHTMDYAQVHRVPRHHIPNRYKRGLHRYLPKWLQHVADYHSVDPETTPLRSPRTPSHKLGILSYRVIAVSCFGTFSCFYIVSIESVIFQNHIQNLSTAIGPGQIIPLTIGVGSFAVLVVNMLYEYR